MSFSDWNEFIQRDIVPGFVDTVVLDAIKPFTRYFGTTPPDGGDVITSRYRVGYTSNAAAYDKSDVDPAVSTQTLVKPYWTKAFYHGACETHGIDISNARPGSDGINMVAEDIKKEVESVMDIVQAAFLARLLADVDSSATAYSDGSLSRSTYATLASYEEETDATITLAYMRGMIQNVTLNKPVNLADYVCMCEGATFYTFQALAAAIHAWNINDPGTRQAQGMGYRPMNNFEGLDMAPPTDFTNMTTGSLYMLRKQDVNIVPHMPLEVVAVPSGRHSLKYVIRVGINIYVDNPYFQGKMLNKD